MGAGGVMVDSELGFEEPKLGEGNESGVAASWPRRAGGGTNGGVEWVALSVGVDVGMEPRYSGFIGGYLIVVGASWDGVGQKALGRGTTDGWRKWFGLDVCVGEEKAVNTLYVDEAAVRC